MVMILQVEKIIKLVSGHDLYLNTTFCHLYIYCKTLALPKSLNILLKILVSDSYRKNKRNECFMNSCVIQNPPDLHKLIFDFQ